MQPKSLQHYDTLHLDLYNLTDYSTITIKLLMPFQSSTAAPTFPRTDRDEHERIVIRNTIVFYLSLSLDVNLTPGRRLSPTIVLGQRTSIQRFRAMNRYEHDKAKTKRKSLLSLEKLLAF